MIDVDLSPVGEQIGMGLAGKLTLFLVEILLFTLVLTVTFNILLLKILPKLNKWLRIMISIAAGIFVSYSLLYII